MFIKHLNINKLNEFFLDASKQVIVNKTLNVQQMPSPASSPSLQQQQQQQQPIVQTNGMPNPTPTLNGDCSNVVKSLLVQPPNVATVQAPSTPNQVDAPTQEQTACSTQQPVANPPTTPAPTSMDTS